MRVERCDDCGRQVDTDMEEITYDEDGAPVCDGCIERREAEHRSALEDQRLDDPRRGQAAELNRRY